MRKFLVFLMLLMVGMLPFVFNEKAAIAQQNIPQTNWDSQAALNRVNNLGQRLLKTNGLPTEKILFKVSEEDHVNAYANIKDEVWVYRGLLNNVGNDDGELVAVLSHELGHIVNAHVKKTIALNIGVAVAVAGASVADSYVKKPSVINAINKWSPVDISIASATSVAGTMVSNKVSREEEFEADLTGVDILVNAGYNPLAMISLLNKISGNYFDLFSTHPSGERRLMNIYDYVAYNYPKAIEIGYNTESYKRALIMINQNLQARDLEEQKDIARKQAKLKKDKEERAEKLKTADDPWLLDWSKQGTMPLQSQLQPQQVQQQRPNYYNQVPQQQPLQFELQPQLKNQVR